jgi:hypothetical protein
MNFTLLKPKHFPWFDYSRYSFSMGLQSASGTWLSGNTASEFDVAAKRIVVKGGMTEQVRTAWAKIGAILESGGLSYGEARGYRALRRGRGRAPRDFQERSSRGVHRPGESIAAAGRLH